MIEKIKTDTGIEVIFDKLKSISTCSVDVFVKTGSRDENDTEEGISHVLEHMIFKGTPTRSYFEISEEIDYLGANVNAHTTKEETVFYINALTQFLGKSVDILFEIVTNSTIDEKELGGMMLARWSSRAMVVRLITSMLTVGSSLNTATHRVLSDSEYHTP